MRISNFGYLFKEGARNVLHNKLMSLASIGVLVACLLLIGSAALFSLNVNNIVHYVEQQNAVTIILEDGLGEEETQELELILKNMDNILDITFISRAEALESQKERVGEFASLFDGLEEDNPMPDSYLLRIGNTSILEKTVGELGELDGVEKVNSANDVAHVLNGLKTTVSVSGTAVVLILVVVSVVIITNTIKLTVFSRRKEINIMKYVGATDSFIRLPFVVEGVIIGLVAATLAFLVLGFGYTYLLEWIETNYIDQIALVYNNAIEFWDIAHYVFVVFAGMGIVLGMLGSSVFVRKYLKV